MRTLLLLSCLTFASAHCMDGQAQEPNSTSPAPEETNQNSNQQPERTLLLVNVNMPEEDFFNFDGASTILALVKTVHKDEDKK